MVMSGAIGLGIGGKGGRVVDGGKWNGLNGLGRGLKGFQPSTENKVANSLFALGSDLFILEGLFL
jgi:hypothetical protein